MIRLFIIFVFSVLMPLSVFSTEFSGFSSNITNSSLKAFAKDMGGILGGGANNTARSLGFSGFDLGYKQIVQLKPSLNNTVLNSERAINLGWVQAEIGMPYRVDGFIRGMNDDGFAVTGGGLRYGLRRISDKPGYMQIMLILMGNMATHRDFYLTHVASQVYISRNAKVMMPYIGFGFDSTKLFVNRADDTSLIGKKVYTFEGRFTAGIKFKLRFFYLGLGGAITHGRTSCEGSFGARF
ncbi:MAG: hypothetical protein U9Q34_02045 [Elusimicrobiota bacterium]|nr:hypothetical protein [Elusimicrobiota bacterium]